MPFTTCRSFPIVYLYSKLSCRTKLRPGPALAFSLFLFSLFPSLLSPSTHKAVWDRKTFWRASPPLGRLWIKRDTTGLLSRERDGALKDSRFSGVQKAKNVPSYLYMTYWDVLLKKSIFKVVMFCSKLFSFSEGRF